MDTPRTARSGGAAPTRTASRPPFPEGPLHADDRTLRRRSDLLAACLLLAALLFLGPDASAQAENQTQPETPSLRLAPCRVPGVPTAVRCGIFDVAENPDDPGGRRLALDVVVVPSRGERPIGSVFVLAGGPGQAATDLVRLDARRLDPVRDHHRLVYLDQRGTAGSHRLDCDLGDDLAVFASAGFGGDGDLADCSEELSRGADLRFYGTAHFADDLEALRVALGEERVDLLGGSYGTRAAMAYALRYPGSVRSLVLDGVAPPELTLPLYNAREAQAALDHWLAACAADPTCADAFGEVGDRLEALLDRLEEAPAEVRAAHPRTGEPIELTIGRAAVAGTIRALLYQPRMAATVPFLVDRAASGDWAPLVAAGVAVSRSSRDTMSLGLTLSILCSEDVARIEDLDPERVDELTRDSFLGRQEIDAWRAACAGWPALAASPKDTPATSDVPVLFLSGALDPIVPPVWGDLAAERFPSSRHVVIPGAGHNTILSACVTGLVSDFLEETDPDALDTACASAITAPPLTVAAYGPEP